jgi:tripartite-type tricarboxylate transporter receptor subunit TctC
MKRRTSFAAALMGIATLIGAPLATAEYPDKPIKLIVPFPPGGGTDIIARIVGDKLSSSLGWKVIVENKPGAGGTLGMDAAAKSKPDGYTWVLGQTSNLSIAPSLMASLPYDPVKNFTPVTLVDEAALAITVGANSPIKTLADLVAEAKAKPGKLLMASPGNATVAHLTGSSSRRPPASSTRTSRTKARRKRFRTLSAAAPPSSSPRSSRRCPRSSRASCARSPSPAPSG